MTKATRAQYTLEFKQEAVQMVESGQSIAAAARSLGVVERTLYNWVKAQREGRRKGPAHKSVPSKWKSVGHEPSWRAVKVERDILGRCQGTSTAGSGAERPDQSICKRAPAPL